MQRWEMVRQECLTYRDFGKWEYVFLLNPFVYICINKRDGDEDI